jgi:hypothetical protein
MYIDEIFNIDIFEVVELSCYVTLEKEGHFYYLKEFDLQPDPTEIDYRSKSLHIRSISGRVGKLYVHLIEDKNE